MNQDKREGLLTDTERQAACYKLVGSSLTLILTVNSVFFVCVVVVVFPSDPLVVTSVLMNFEFFR